MSEVHARPKRVTTEGAVIELHAVAQNGADVSPDEFLDKLAFELARRAPKQSGGGGGEPPKTFLGLDGGAWTKLLFWGVLGCLAALGSWALVVHDTMKEHAHELEVHESLPMHTAAVKEVRQIRQQVDTVEAQQRKIAQGIEQLKKEQVDDLKEELREARRKLRDRSRR